MRVARPRDLSESSPGARVCRVRLVYATNVTLEPILTYRSGTQRTGQKPTSGRAVAIRHDV